MQRTATAKARASQPGIRVLVAVAAALAVVYSAAAAPVTAVPRRATDEAIVVPAAPVAATTFVDITPSNLGPYAGQPAAGIPDCPAPCESGLNGGRVHNMSVVPIDPSTYYAASEVGGLYKSSDGGTTWGHLDGYLPGTAWDVAAATGGRVYATSFNEGRLDLTSVLQVSTDAGTTWTGILPAAPAGCSASRSAQPSGFGIGLRPGTDEVLVGTNCGLARSTNAGADWARFDPTPGTAASSVWDVVALAGGRTYACGSDGLLYSATGASGGWVNLGAPAGVPGGFCSLAASPDEDGVVFAMFANPQSYGEVFLAGGGTLYQGVLAFDGSGAATGVTWVTMPNPDASIGGPKSRLPFVVVNDRTTGYDVWAGIGNVVRGTCATPAGVPAATTPRCSAWSDTYTDKNGQLVQQAHGDSGDMEFEPSAGNDACPTLFSSDGGIYRNTRTSSPTCHDPLFHGSNDGLDAFLLWDMEAVGVPGADPEQLYFGTQDNGLYYTANAGAPSPTWNHRIGGDLYDLAADATRAVGSTNGGEIMAGNAGFTGMTAAAPGGTIKSNPPLDIPEFIARAGSGRFMIANSVATSLAGTAIPIGVRDTSDIVNDPLGTAVGTWPSSRPPCHIVVGAGPTGPQPYVLAGRCFWPDSGARSAYAADELWTAQETVPGTWTWQQIAVPPATPGGSVPSAAGFGLVAVDPTDANRVYASVVRDGNPRMMRSSDGGTTWTRDAELTDLMLGGGRFIAYPATTGDGIAPYLQPLFVAFDPDDPDILVAGGASSGVFISSDGGSHWALLTDPYTSAASGIPHLPRPQFAHFDHDTAGLVRVYLGTGRGIWRVDLAEADVSVTKAGSPDPVVAGTDLTYTLTVSNAGPSTANNVTLRDVLPSDTVFKSLAAPAGWACETPVVGAGGTVECTKSTLAPGLSTFQLVVHVAHYVADGSTIANVPVVTSAAIDPDPSDNTMVETVQVIAQADLAVTKTDSPDPAFAGESLTYTITVRNGGPSTATGITVVDTLPADVTYTSGPGSCAALSQVVTCAVGTFGPGAELALTIKVGVPAGLVYANGGPKTIDNAGTVSGNQTDPDPSDNTEGESTLVKAKADLAIISFAAIAPPPQVIIGTPVTLTLRKVVTNLGPSSPIDVLLSRTATAPAGSSVTPATSSETLLAAVKDVPRTVDETFTINCGVPGPQTFSFGNTIVPDDAADVDPNLANNTAGTTVTVDCVVPVAINIKPGSFPNAMNLNGDATVAVLTTKVGEYGLPLAFDATTIHPLSVRFGPASLVFPGLGGAPEVHATGHIQDARELNEKTRDRDLDMALHFRVAASGLTLGSTESCVKGTFTQGSATYSFFGCDSVKVTP